MERNSRNGRTFRVHRDFECSRFEQVVLAEAYRRILPNDRLKLLERDSIVVDRHAGEGQYVLHDDTNLTSDYFTTMGGSSR